MASTKLVTQRKAGPVYGFKTLEEDAPPGTFEAIVSVFDNVDYSGERVRPDAFAGSLARWQESGDPIPVIFSHRWDELDAHVGVVLEARELGAGDARLPDAIRSLGGLYIKGQLDIAEDFAGRLWKRMKRRSIKEFSFAYDVLKAQPAEDGVLDLVELDLIEVGPTLKGMNPLTELVGAKTRRADDALAALELADLEDVVFEDDEDDVEPDDEDDADLEDAELGGESAADAGAEATVPEDGKAEPELDGKAEAESNGETERAALEAELAAIAIDLP